MSYSDLTETEQHYWDEYATLRAITDWEGFTEAQDNRKRAARDWLVNQRKEIWRCAEGKKPQECKPGWDINNRSARYATLSDDNLNNATAKHEYTLPAGGCVPSEKSYIEEREGYLMIGGDGASADDEQKARKTANSDWLVERRKKVWHLGEDEGWDEAERELRYENLCIATHYGSPWDAYESSHNKYGQTIHEDTGGDGSSRGKCVSNMRGHLGVKENPSGSNKGNPQPSKWQQRVYGDDGVPWCACFSSCMAWDVGVKGSGSAAVTNLVSMAKAGTGMMRGWTTDPGNVLRGDFAIVGCTTCHVGVVCDSDNAMHLIEGNGDDGGSYNGGEVVEKTRSRGEIVGWCLVNYP